MKAILLAEMFLLVLVGGMSAFGEEPLLYETVGSLLFRPRTA